LPQQRSGSGGENISTPKSSTSNGVGNGRNPKPSTSTGSGKNGCPYGYAVATMTGYNNLDSSDDPNSGFVAEFTTNKNFLSHVPVASVNSPDFNKYKYHNIFVVRVGTGQNATLQSWDECSNSDCPSGAGADCCTVNARQFGGNFLLDVEHLTLARLFGISNFNNVDEKVCFMIGGSFNPDSIAAKYGCRRS